MPFTFTPNEYIDMLLIFGECRKNKHAAQMLYRDRFPERRQPACNTFIYVEKKMRTGSFPGKTKQVHPMPTRTEENRINVLAYTGAYPHISVRALSVETGISKSTVQRILSEYKYHPFKIHLHQELRVTDYDRRLTLIAQFHVLINENPNFLNQILWSDESRFHNNGTVNRHNMHYWSQENPNWIRETNFQTMWGINVWCGLYNGRLIGPYFFQDTLTGVRYLEFLQNSLPELMEDVPLAERPRIWFQQDGAPPHNSRIVTNYLNNTFEERWMGTTGPVRWPARSPDLTPLDFFLWGYLKQLVYDTQPTSLEDLTQRIIQACNTVTPEMIKSACTRALMLRFEACLAENGRQFEHKIA